jgi:hypothetical protein
MSEQAGAEVAPVQQTTEIIDESALADLITQPSTGALQRLEAEARAMATAYKIASALSKTQMVPELYQQSYTGTRNNPHPPLGEKAAWNLTAAILFGSELGLSAVQSAQNVFIVRGKPAVYARTMAACVRRAGFVIEPVEESDERCVWKALRDGTWAYSEWTMERAERAEYTSNELYRKNPQEMLRAKCIAEVCRVKFQDVITGLAYSVEELQLQDVTVQRVTKQGVRGTAKLREIAEGIEKGNQAEARYDDDGNQITPPEDDPPEAPPGATNQQLVEIRKLYKLQGKTGQAILDDLNMFLQREEPLKSLHELSHDDAAGVITNLNKPVAESQKESGENTRNATE